MSDQKKHNLFNDISLLYELALNMGQSLNLQETVADFADLILFRKNLSNVSVWLNRTTANFEDNKKPDEYFLYYSTPLNYTKTTKIPKNHILYKLLTEDKAIHSHYGEKLFDQLTFEKDINTGFFVIYKLQDFGFIKLYSSKSQWFSLLEINKMKALMKKFANSIIACLVYEKAKEQFAEQTILVSQKNNTLEQLTILINNLQGGILFEDENRNITHINQPFCEIFQIPVAPEHLVGINCASSAEDSKHLIADPQQFVERIGVVLKESKSVLGEEILFQDGRVFERDYIPIKTGKQLNGHLWLYREITDRVQQESTLRLQNIAFESITYSVCIANNKGEIQWVNSALNKLTGYTPDELSGRSFKIFSSGIQSKLFYKTLWKTILKGEIWQGHLVNKRKDGTLYHENQIITPVLNKQGEITHFIVVKNDISKQIALQKSLQESDQRWMYALEGAGDGVWDWNLLTDEVFFSDSYKQMLGYESDDFGSSISEWSKRVHPDDLQKCYAQLNDHFSGKTKSYLSEHRMKHKSGKYIWILDRGKVIARDSKNKPTRIIGTHTDITYIKDVEIKLHQTIEKERELGELKSQFVSIASHEFRTPLATILAATEILSDYRAKMTDEDIDKRLTKIKGQVCNLTKIVEDVLGLSRLQEDAQKLNLSTFDLIEFSKSLIEEIIVSENAARIIFSSFSSIVIMNLDAGLMRQIIMNLLSNALKFSKSNVFFSIEASAGNILIKVTDKGIGIPSTEMENILDPFIRGNNTTGIAGTGLGLSIVHEAVKKHGGKMHIDSKIKIGTTVSIYLPLK